MPTWLIMMGFMWFPILLLGIDQAFYTPRGLLIVGIAMSLGIVAAWAWWSVMAPRWRLWAYQRVTDLFLLEELAVAEKLVWPIDHLFTRTELRTGPTRDRLRTYEAEMRQVR